jgi:predicted RNA-binding protein with EMAP domain
MSKTVVVETSNIVYALARQREIRLALRDNATYADLVAALAQAVPALVGEVISKDKRHLVGDYLLNVGGRVSVQDLSQVADIREGERVIFLTDAC